jgi:hypothetical protein
MCLISLCSLVCHALYCLTPYYTQVTKRVRDETKKLWKDMQSSSWIFPEEPNAAFHQVPSEALVTMFVYAIGPPYHLPWNAQDFHVKACFFILVQSCIFIVI